MCCYQLQDIPLDLSQPITGSLASQYWNSSVIGGGAIYLVTMLRSTALISFVNSPLWSLFLAQLYQCNAYTAMYGLLIVHVYQYSD